MSVPDKHEQRLMLTEALKISMMVVMSNDVYMFDGKMHHQQLGGSIGLVLTGNIAQWVTTVRHWNSSQTK